MRTFKVLVLLTLLAAVPILAAEEPNRVAASPLATMHVTPDAVSWEAVADFGGLELAVAFPDGTILRRQFTPGETPTFALFDEGGQPLADGAYTYELRTAREMRPGRSLLLSGTIGIQDGSFVDLLTLGDRPDRGPKPVFETDVVHNDELIVNGNGACIGSGCAAGDADAQVMAGGLRLKSVAPQIWLEDTGGGSSGSHDWLIATDGAFFDESFKIFDLDSGTRPFTLTGNAPNHSLFVDSSGNVGLGTSIPAARLEVSGGEVRFPAGAGGAGFTHFNLYSDGKNYIRGTTIIADNAGSVGIGTTAPASKLHVNGGDVRVSGGSFIDDGVTILAPDYVFEPDYDLMPLDELAAFVRAEKHLPNVPNAAEIRASGLNLSQFQMRLLEKIEELTLYTLAQQEQIAALAAKLEALEAK